MNNWNLEGRKALVTGGTKGIGLAVVKEFLSLGAEVIFTSRTAEQVRQTEEAFNSQGLKALGITADVSLPQDRKKLVQEISEKWGTLDILVNNAGINIRKGTTDYQEEEFRKILEINMMAPFELSRELYPLLKEARQAAIVNVSSIGGSMDVGTGSPYGMSKGALIQLSRNLAGEWVKDGIRVNTVSPWYTKTPLTEGVLDDEQKYAKIMARTPLERIADTEEMAAAIAFLAMNKASYITGQNLIVDGGMSIKGL